MENYDDLLREIKEIRKLLTIIAQDKLSDFNASIEEKYLKSPQRKQMYELMDGEHSLKDIASAVNVSSEAVRQFCVLLEQNQLIEYIIISGRQRNPKRLF